MDAEQTFIRVQERFSQILTPKVRAALEYIYLFIALTLFFILVVMHANYVQQPGCSSELSGVETTEAQIIQIKMVREMDEILRQQIAQPANSCTSEENGVSFLDQVIYPLYEVVAAEAANNDNGKAPHSAWRNYDDFNEYFWSLHCFELSWPWRRVSSFFQKPVRGQRVY